MNFTLYAKVPDGGGANMTPGTLFRLRIVTFLFDCSANTYRYCGMVIMVLSFLLHLL